MNAIMNSKVNTAVKAIDDLVIRITPAMAMVHLFLVCLLTPISIMIQQDYNPNSAITVLLILCDCKSASDCLISIYNGRWQDLSFPGKAASISSFPSVFLLQLAFQENGEYVRVLLWVSIGRLAVIAQYDQITRSFDTWVELKLKKYYNEYIVHAFNAIVRIFLYASLLACIWFFISCQDRSSCKSSYDPSPFSSWINNDIYLHIGSVASCYARSLHFIMQTLLTVGYGDIHPINNIEVVFSLYVIVNGAVFYGYLISAITVILDTKDITTKSFRTKVNKIRDYFKLRMTNSIGVSDIESVKASVIRYSEYMNKTQFGLSERELLGSLPPAIVHEIKMTYFDQLKGVPFFKSQSQGLVSVALDKMELITFEPDAKISDIYQDEAVLLLLISGKVDLLSCKASKTLHTFVAGDCIGEYDLITSSLNTGDRLTKTKEYYCETRSFTTCLVLSYSSFCAVLKESQYLLMDNRDDTNALEVLEATVEYLIRNEAANTAAAVQTAVEGTVDPPEDDSVQDISMSTVLPESTTNTASSVFVERKHRRSALASIPQRHSLCSQTQSVSETQTRSVSNSSSETGCFYSRIDSGVKATFVGHQNFLNKLEKTQTTIDNNARKKRMAGMLEVYVPASRSSSRVILPGSWFVLAWNCVLLLCILYYNLVVPLRIMVFYNCTNSQSTSVAKDTAHSCLSQWTWSLLVDYLCDLIFIVDLVLQSRYFAFTSVEGEEEVTISDADEIFDRFKNSIHFYIDVFTILPLDIISLGFGYVLCLRVLKVTTIALIPKVISSIQAYLDKEKNLTISSEAITVIYLGIGTLLISVWTGTLWIVLRYTGLSAYYVDAYYWCFTTMTTTGYGDVYPVTTLQTIVNICCSFIGPITFATIIAKMASYVKQANVSTANPEYRLTTSLQYLKTSSYLAADCSKDEQVLSVETSERDTARSSFLQRASFTASYYSAGGKYHTREEFQRQRMVHAASKSKPKRLTSSITRNGSDSSALVESMLCEYYEHLSRSQAIALSEEQIQQWGLPHYLQGKTKQLVVESMLIGCNIFSKCDAACQNELMHALQQVFVSKHTVISNSRSPSDGMYFIRSGSVKVRQHGDQRCLIKVQGDCFLEKSLIQETATAASHCEYTACSDCELWFLSRTSFLFALHNHPANHDKMVSITAAIEQLGMLGKKNTLSARIEKSEGAGRAVVILPDSTVAKLWSVLIALVTTMVLIMLPFQIAYLQDLTQSSTLINVAIDVILAVDVLLRLFLLAYQDQDEMVVDVKKIVHNYSRSTNFLFHVVSVLPTDLFISVRCIGTLNKVQSVALLRLNRLFRLVDVHVHIQVAEKVILSAVKDHFMLDVPYNAIRLIKLVLAIIVVAHLFGSMFFIIANQYHLQGNGANWADHAGLFELSLEIQGRSISQCIHSIYWAITVLCTVGYGDIVPVNVNEKVYNIILYLLGAFVFAMIIVNLQEIVSQLDVTSDIHKRKVNRVRAFVDKECNDVQYTEKVQKYYSKLWSQHKGAQGVEIMHFMPSQLYLASIYNVASEPTSKLFFVSKCTQSFQRQFISKLVVQQYLKGDSLFKNGERSTKLFLLCTGEVALVSYDTQVDTCTETNNRLSVRELVSAASSPKITAGFNNRESFRAGRKKKSSYQKLTEGYVGESEFFSRSCYACSGSATADSVLFTIDFDSFWSLVVQHQLVHGYVKTTQKDTARMQRNSTLLLVQKINNNIANAKMSKMVSNSNLSKNNDRCLMPDSVVVQTLNLLCFLVLVVECICVPYFIVFPSTVALKWQILLDSLYILLFGADMYGKLTLFAVETDGSIVTDPEKFRSIYFRSFKRDLLSTMPLSLVLLGLHHNVVSVFSWVRLLYLLRMQSIPKMAQKAYHTMEGYWKVSVGDAKLRVISTIIVALYIVHVIACIFSFIGKIEQDAGNPSWIDVNAFDHLTSVELYLRSYYWGLYTITTVGYGSISMASDSERIFAACVMILGSIVCATLSAMLSFWVETSDGANGSFRRCHEATLRFCSTYRLDKSLQDKINGHFKYLSDTSMNSSESEDLSLLPSQLRTELILRKIWRNVKNELFLDAALFDKTAQRGYVLSLLPYFELYMAVPKEVILQCTVSLLLKEKTQRTSTVCLLQDLFVLRRGQIMSAIQKNGSSESSNLTSNNPNEVLKLENVLPKATLDPNVSQKYSYQVRLLRISTRDSVESRIRLVNATWFVDGTKKFNESSVAVQSRSGNISACFDPAGNALDFSQHNESIVGTIHCGHSQNRQMTYQVGTISMNIPYLLDIANRDLHMEELTSDDSSCSSDISSRESTPPIKTRPSTILSPQSNRPSRIVPITTDALDQLIDVEDGEPREMVQPFSDCGSDSSEDLSVEDQNDRGVHEFSRDIVSAEGDVVGTAVFEMVITKTDDMAAVVEEKVVPSSPSSPNFKRRMSDVLSGLGTRSSTRALISPPTSPTSYGGQRRMSGVLLSSILGGSSPDKSISAGCLTDKTTSMNEQILRCPDKYTAVMYSEGYSHLFRVPVARLQEMKDFYMMTRESPLARVNKLPRNLK